MAKARDVAGTDVAVPRKGGALAKWEAQLAQDAKAEADNEQLPGGQFLSIKAGVLSLAGQPIEDNKLDVVIVDHVFENAYYTGRYDPDNPSSPICYAFGREEESMAPADDVEEKQNDACAGCPQNVFGTADEGRRPGKACKNGRRLALLSAEGITAHAASEGEIAFLKVPPTSLKGWAYYVKSLASTYRRPTYGVVTTIGVVPDQKDQVRVTFVMKELLDAKVLAAIAERREAVKELIIFPYAKNAPVVARAPARRGGGRAAPARAPAAKAAPGKFRVR